MTRRLAAIAVCALLAAPAYAADHVRVVIDLSKSMGDNDKKRLATLSAALLFDLANPDATRGDTFEVIPFDPDMGQWRPPEPFRMTTGRRLKGTSANRAPFIQALVGLPYTAKYTYFYPTLTAAVADFEALPAQTDDRRVIVLVTDGVPLDSTREAEERLLRESMLPRLRAAGARLYVLAFGAVADRERAFFDRLVAGVGELFVDRSGDGLLQSMIEIFSSSFGFTASTPTPHQARSELDLEAGESPTEVAVIQLGLSPQPKSFAISPAPNMPRPIQRTQEKGAGYALTWILQPRSGRYTVVSDQSPGILSVLRPARLRVAVRAGRSGVRPDVAIARTPFPLQVIVSSAAGSTADPGDVDLSYEVCLQRESEWICGNPVPPVRPTGTRETAGRIYDILPTFLTDTDPNVEFYPGQLRITARRHDAVVGRHVHRVSVYPFVELTPTPPILTVPMDRVAMGPGGRGCAQFSLLVTGGRLPHSGNPNYAVRIVLPASVGDMPEFSGATFLIDDAVLDLENAPRPVPGPWYSGRALSGDALLAPHEICVQMGRPAAGAVNRPAAVELAVHLMEAPYDAYTIAPRPIMLGALVAPPGWIDRAAPLVVALSVVSTMALLWYGRSRPYVAGDLGCVLSTVKGGRRLSDNALAAGPWLTRSLGLAVSRPIVTHTGTIIGWVRPVSRELYDLRLARGVTLQSADPGTLETRQTYVINTSEGQMAMRVEYV